MTRQARWIALACKAACCVAAALVAHAQEPTFTAAFVDGTYVTGGRISQWHQTGVQPQLNGRAIFDPAQPIRWLRNESNEPIAIPSDYVEMFGGDRLPGSVVEYRGGKDPVTERPTAHLIVKPAAPIDVPGQPPRETLRVAIEPIRRVVWRRRSVDRYVPATLFYLDGRELTFRALRWSAEGVTLLTSDGTRKVPFSEIAELHLPRREPWEAHFDALAALTPDCSARLMRVESFSGLVATTSLASWQARALSGEPGKWYHLVEPAWSPDGIWVRFTDLAWRRFYLPHEVPLALIEPERVVQRSTFGGGWTWQVDRNVDSRPLRSGGKLHGWGLGVQAHCELSFALPRCARAFRTRVGLDESVGNGGCVRARVYANDSNGKPLYESKVIVGSAEVLDSGSLELVGPAGGQKSLVLVADPVENDRPPGADPLDIRDRVDWLEPIVELNLAKLRGEAESRFAATISPSLLGMGQGGVEPRLLDDALTLPQPLPKREGSKSLAVGDGMRR